MSATENSAPRDCVACAHGKFERTPTGRVKAQTPGRCQAEPELKAPASVRISWSRNGIWPGDGLNCTMWEARV